jgi:hypothetical protein
MRRLLPLVALVLPFSVAGARPAHAAGAIRATVSPQVLLADGISTATVTAEVRSTSGRPVRDGTEVRFYTTAGSITQVAFTSAGVARATLTASNVPQAVNVSVSAGLDQVVITVPMVSKLVEANVGGRVMRIRGNYVAFSEDKRYIQADEQVKLEFRGVTLEANSVQIDLNRDNVKALGKVMIASDDQSLVGERLWWDMRTFEGYMVAVGSRKWFSGYGLTELPEKPKNLNPDFDLVDFSDSRMIWVGKQANYVFGERVQMQNARAYVAGIKSVKMRFQETNLRSGFGEERSQYVGIGTEGITLDLPLYVRMTPGSSTAFRVGYGANSMSSGGIGNFTRNRGLSVDLVQKYGFAGASEGEATLTNLSSPQELGFFWGHTQQLNKTTRLVSTLQFPEHKDLYGQLNLTSGLPIGNLQVSLAASKPGKGTLGHTMSFAFETKPKPVADGKLALSAETSFYRREAQTTRLFKGAGRLPLLDTQYQAVGVKARPQSLGLGGGFTLDSSASLRMVSGGYNAGFGPAFETQIRRTLPNNGYLSFGLNYNHLTAVSDLLPTTAKMNATLNASYPITKRLRLAAMGTMGLDANTRHSIFSASYQFSDKWRLDMLHTMFRFGEFGNYDFQIGLARALGGRELGIYWSRVEHKFIIEFGAARF